MQHFLPRENAAFSPSLLLNDFLFAPIKKSLIGMYNINEKKPDVVACTCNPATLEAEFRNGVGSVPVGGNSPSIGGWIV